MTRSPKQSAKQYNEANIRQYQYDMNTYAAQKADLEREVELQNQISGDTFKYQQEVRNLEKLSILDQYKKSQKDYQQQLLYNQQAADAAVDSQNRYYKDQAGELKEQAEDLKIGMKRSNIATAYSLGQIDFSLDQAIYKSNQDKKSAQLDYRNQMLSIGAERSNLKTNQQLLALNKLSLGLDKKGLELDRRGLELEERDAIADRNFDIISANIDYIEQEGAARATGQTGQSAAASMQTAKAAFALDSAKISDALYRKQESIDLREDELDLRGKSLDIKGKELNVEGTALRREGRRLDSKTSLAKQSRNMAVYQANKSKEFAKRGAKLDVKQIADTLNLDVEVFQLSQKRLGESLVAAAEARKFAMREIARGKVQADKQARSMRMLPPRFAPDPPRPYEAEMPTLVPPPKPVRVQRKTLATPQPKKQSGFSKILGIGASILGIAGAAFTGGASLAPALGVTSGLFASGGAAAGIGAGLGAASSGLATISKYTY